MRSDVRPFLKWPGGKYRLLSRIRQVLHPGKRLIEPFVGSGAVFLNTDYDAYLLADANPDLISLYSRLLEEGTAFISYCRKFFDSRSNTPEAYYAYRDEFNETGRARRKSALFLYLNRHGYNGLCRYNGKGGFNTPFGRYDKPYFPEKEMQAFVRRSQGTTLLQARFDESMAKAQPGDAVYCDPPYVPLSETAHFTDYHAGGFAWVTRCASQTLPANWRSTGSRLSFQTTIPGRCASYITGETQNFPLQSQENHQQRREQPRGSRRTACRIQSQVRSPSFLR